MTMVILFAAFMHLHLITSYPPGLDSDSAHDGLDALKFIRHGVWPFYITINSNADPLFVYTAAASTQLLGERVISMRLPSALYSLLGFAMVYTCLAELGRDSFDCSTRHQIAVLAVAALATSQVLALINRMGLRFSTQMVFQMAAIWALARALRTGHRGLWIVAGLLAGLTQYTYPSARVLPLLLFLVLLLKLPRQWWKDKPFFTGLMFYAGATVVALLPQIIWYANYPATFLARAGQTSITQNPLYAKVGLLGTLLDKFSKYGQALGTHWLGQYDQIKEPLLGPLFYLGFILGVGACVILARRRFVPLLICGLLVMALPDLISGDREWPHELRLIGAYPFVAGIAGLGLIGAWRLSRRWARGNQIIGLLLAAAVGWTMFQQARSFFSFDLNRGKLYWSANTWLRRIDAGTATMIANSSESYLIPLSNYSDTVIKYLTANRARQIRSALDSSGRLLPFLQHGTKIFLPHEDSGGPWQGDPTQQWVLFEGDTAYILPPILNIASYLPALEDSTLVYGSGVEEIVQIGHRGEIAPGQLSLAQEYPPDFSEHICFKNGLCLSGVIYSQRQLEPNGQLQVGLYWRPTAKVKEDYIMFVHLLDRNGAAVAGVDGYPLSEGYRTYEWRTDETVVSLHNVKLPADLPPGPYSIEVGFYPPYALSLVETIDETGQVTGDRAYVTHLKVPQPSMPAENAGQVKPSAVVGDAFKLYGASAAMLPDGQVKLSLFWESLVERPEIDATIFVHVQNASGDLIAGQDARPDGYPTFIWSQGERVETDYTLNLSGLSPDDLKVFVGMYTFPDLTRLPVLQNDELVAEARVELGRLTELMTDGN